MFKTILNSFRSYKKPGTSGFFNSNFNPALNVVEYPIVEDNVNIDPLADNLGNQWVRDASDPQAYRDSSNTSDGLGFPITQQWDRFPNFVTPQALGYWIGQGTFGGGGGNVGFSCALYDLSAYAYASIDGAVQPWEAEKLYLQLFTAPAGAVGGNNEGVFPAAGGYPAFSIPIKPPPDLTTFTPGVKTPFNSVAAVEGGIGIFLSTDPFQYAQPAGGGGELYFFGVNVTWAFYKR